MLRRLFSIKVRDNILSDMHYSPERMRITRYPNSDLIFRLQRLLSCGDVSTNPGQVDALNSRSNP